MTQHATLPAGLPAPGPDARAWLLDPAWTRPGDAPGLAFDYPSTTLPGIVEAVLGRTYPTGVPHPLHRQLRTYAATAAADPTTPYTAVVVAELVRILDADAEARAVTDTALADAPFLSRPPLAATPDPHTHPDAWLLGCAVVAPYNDLRAAGGYTDDEARVHLALSGDHHGW